MAKQESGFTEAEMNELKSAANEPAETETQEVAETKPEPVKAETKAAKEPEKDKAETKEADKPGKPPKGYVPQEALAERDHTIKDMRGKIQKMEGLWQKLQSERAEAEKQARLKAEQDQIPAFETDPAAHLRAVLDRTQKQLQEITGEHQQRRQMDEQNARTNAMLEAYATDVRNFSRTTDDFNAAYDWLAAKRDAELLALGFNDPIERTNTLQYEEGKIVARAILAGKSPAEMLYKYATTAGYKKAEPEKPKEAEQTQETKIERLQRGEKAAKSLNGGKSDTSEGPPTLESIAGLDGEDFDKAWDKWARGARRAG